VILANFQHSAVDVIECFDLRGNQSPLFRDLYHRLCLDLFNERILRH
jgi:hypothetical protein